jgi:hypothetical protein
MTKNKFDFKHPMSLLNAEPQSSLCNSIINPCYAAFETLQDVPYFLNYKKHQDFRGYILREKNYYAFRL